MTGDPNPAPRLRASGYLSILILIISLPLLFSCQAEEEFPTDSITDDISSEISLPDVYRVTDNGKSDFSIITSSSLGSDALAATNSLQSRIAKKYGVTLDLKSDGAATDPNGTVTTGEDVREILIGDTNRAESVSVASEYSDIKAGYTVKAVNGKIVIRATDETFLVAAIEYFCSELMTDGELTVPKDHVYLWDLTGADMPLSLIANEYSVLYDAKAPEKVKRASRILAGNIGNEVGRSLSTAAAGTDKSQKELLIGDTDRQESIEAAKTLNYMDYTIRTYESSIVVLGGSPLATEQATRVFLELLKNGKIRELGAGFVYDYDYDLFISDSLAYHQDEFVPKWTGSFTPPEWMLDYEEKLYALTYPKERLVTNSHRGDVQHYPENSLEGILSAILMGADVVEIDVRLTKDNVMVLMHDETLERTTDWSKKKGKNGLPVSAYISDWTYEQLQELNLVMKDKTPTDCKIPTLYEAALLFIGRAQLNLDCKVSAHIDKNTDIYPLAEETGSKECFFYTYGKNVMLEWYAKNPSDVKFKDFVKKISLYLAQSGHSLRKQSFSMLEKHGDHSTGWRKTFNEGYTVIYTDKIFTFCRYMATNEQPLKLPN